MDGVPFLFNYSFRGLHSPDPFPESIPGLHSRENKTPTAQAIGVLRI